MYTMIHVHRDDIDFLLMASVNEWFCLITVILHVYTDRADKKQWVDIIWVFGRETLIIRGLI